MLPKEGFEVVISGVGALCPGARNVEELRDRLMAGGCPIAEHDRRWRPGALGTPRATGLVAGEFKFDAVFFGVHRKLCDASEPMMKLALERSFEAFVDAGVNPWTLRGQNVAVVVSAMNSESESLMMTHENVNRTGFGVLGHSQGLIANRISNFYHFNGPSAVVNAGSAGGCAALQHAATLVRQGAVSAAIVCCAYLMWAPTVSTEYDDLGLLTRQPFSRHFSAEADGAIRSEGVVAYFLQRREEALRVYASIVDVDFRYLGDRCCGYIRFDSSMEKYLRDFYRASGCDPSQLSYMETESTSLKDLDAVELDSIADALCRLRPGPLPIGSVKSNLGFAHNVSTFVAVAKALVALETGVIPPTLHCGPPDLDVRAMRDGRLRPVVAAEPLAGRLVGVNCASFSGGVGHVLLRGTTLPKIPPKLQQTTLPRLMVASARHEGGARRVAAKLLSTPFNEEFASLVNNVHKTNILNHIWRTFVVSPRREPEHDPEIMFCDWEKQRPLWFIFSGMGTQWNGMGKELLRIPVFASAMERCEKALSPLKVDVYKILTSDDPEMFENIINSFVGNAAIQVGLMDVARAVGLSPDGVVGHSAGELGCAYADGCLSAEQTVLCAYARGRASLDAGLPRGLMLAVGLGAEEVRRYGIPNSVDVACHNASNSCTLSGPWDDVVRLSEELGSRGVFAKTVSTGQIAFHSRYIKPIAEKLEEKLREIIPSPVNRSKRWISTSVAQSQWDDRDARLASARYFSNNLIEPVLFEEATRLVPDDAIVLEIAPHGLMQAILKRSLGIQCTNLSLTNRNAPSNLHHLLTTLGRLYLHKVDLDVNALYPPVEYPVSRGTPSLAPLVSWDHRDTWFSNFATALRSISEEGSYSSVILNTAAKEYTMWKDYVVEDEVVYPWSQLLVFPFKLLIENEGVQNMEQKIIKLEDVEFTGIVRITQLDSHLEASVLRRSERFEVCVDNRILVTGGLSAIWRHQDSSIQLIPNASPAQDTTTIVVTQEDFYRKLRDHGYRMGDHFRLVQSINIHGKDFEAAVTWMEDWSALFECFVQLGLFFHLQLPSIGAFSRLAGFRSLIFDSARLSNLAKGSLLKIKYNSNMKIFHCDGLQVHNMTFLLTEAKGTTSLKEYVTKMLKTEIEPGGMVSGNCLEKYNLCQISADPDLQVDCVSPNTTTFTVAPKLPCHLMFVKHVDYSGTKDGARVMGVGVCQDGKIFADDVLRWTIPDNWSSEEAASVPFLYSLAFYSLFAKGKLRRGGSVLIHGGASTLGGALVALSAAEGTAVFANVTDRRHADRLLARFPQINPKNILRAERPYYEEAVMRLTKGAGVDVVVNCMPGAEDARASLGVLREWGNMVHLSDVRPGPGERIGMHSFLKTGSYMHGVTFDSVFNADRETKESLRLQVERGIALGHVTPLNLRSFERECVDEAMSHFQNSYSVEKTVFKGTYKQSVIHADPANVTSENNYYNSIPYNHGRKSTNDPENATVIKENHRPEDFEHYLPLSVDNLADYDDGDGSLEVEELTTLSPRYEHVSHQVAPAFFLAGASVRPLAGRLAAPAFRLPGRTASEAAAGRRARLIRSIQPQGPYHLVADPWSGHAALTVAAILESSGEQLVVFLLDAEPSCAQKCAAAFADSDGIFDDRRFLQKMFNLNDEMSRCLCRLPTWADRLGFALDQGHRLEGRRRERIAKGATALRSQLKAVLEWGAGDIKIKGTVHLLVPTCGRNSSTAQDFKSFANVWTIEVSTFEELIENQKTADIINQNMLFSWRL